VKTKLKSVHIYQSYCKKNLAQFFWPTLYIMFMANYVAASNSDRRTTHAGITRASFMLLHASRG